MNSINTSSVIPPTISTYPFNSNRVLLTPPLLEVAPALQEVKATALGRPGGKCDLYTVSEDGHFIGQDGFVVPRSFEEFFERHPRYVRGRVRRLWPNVSSSEREDRESELLIFLMTLPKKSKFRALGYNGFPKGCKDRVQTFSPEHAHGASEPRFFHYIKTILTNHFTSLSWKASLNPVQRYNTLSLYSLDRDGTLIDEAYIYAFTRGGGASAMNYDQLMENGILVDKFVSFVKTHNPELLEVMNTIQMTDTFVEAKHAVGFPERLFIRARNRLAVLYSCFDKGTDPPRQRKVYRSRTPRAK